MANNIVLWIWSCLTCLRRKSTKSRKVYVGDDYRDRSKTISPKKSVTFIEGEGESGEVVWSCNRQYL